MVLLIRPLFLLLLFHISYGYSNNPYDKANIPSELIKDANAVIRKDQRYLEVLSMEKARLQVDKTITILNENGDHLAPVYIYHDPHRKIQQLRCTIFNADGEIIREIDPAEFGDYPAVSSAALFEQLRFKVFTYRPEQYPYTIAYTYEVAMDGLYQYPTWSPISSEGVALQHASFTMDVAADQKFRYKTYHLGDAPNIQKKGHRKLYTWKVDKVKAVNMEALAPDFYEVTPTLLLAPEQFAYDGIHGSAEDWQQFGRWVHQLLEGRNKMPKETVDHVQGLVASVDNPQEKLEIIYKYVKQKVSTVNLPLGIGTYQPLSAEEVDRLGYADSKAMSNYLISLLSEVGMRAHYALINAGKFATSLEEEIPGAQFNRAVVAVPLANDTLWLDGMQSHQPTGFLGYELSDRMALLITERGGKIVKTSAFDAEDNLQARTAEITIQKDGTAQAVVTTHFGGMQYSHISPLMLLAPYQQEEVIYQKTNIKNFDLLSFSYQQKQENLPRIKERLEMKLEHFAKNYHGNLSFVPNLMNQMDGLPPLTESRKYSLVIRRAFLDTDKIAYELPSYDRLELPEEVFIQTEFGEYQMRVRIQEGKLFYERTLKTYQGVFPASSYENLMRFYEAIVRADQRRVTIIGVNEQEAETNVSDTSSLR